MLKVAILAEKYAVDYTWYVDTILNLIRIAGDYVSEEVWYRVIQIVINRDDVQGYAAKTVFEVSLAAVPERYRAHRCFKTSAVNLCRAGAAASFMLTRGVFGMWSHGDPTAPTRPITVAAGCTAVTCSYICREQRVGVRRRFNSRFFSQQTRSEWLQSVIM